MRLRNIHVVITSLCAVAGVIFAGVQTFRSSDIPSAQARPEITGSTSKPVIGDFNSGASTQTKPNVTEVTPTEPPGLAIASLDRARILPGTRPEVPDRYPVAALFDGNPSTTVTLTGGDSDVDFIVELPLAEAVSVTGITIDGGDNAAVAPATLEVMVLPEGSMAGGGREVTSLALSPEGGKQKFSLPPEAGKAVWIRVAGKAGQTTTTIGDITLMTAATP